MLAADAFSLFEPAVQRELSRNLRVSTQRKACWNLQKKIHLLIVTKKERDPCKYEDCRETDLA